MPGGPVMIIDMFKLKAADIFFSQPIHDGFHGAAVYSGDREELNEDQVIMFGDKARTGGLA